MKNKIANTLLIVLPLIALAAVIGMRIVACLPLIRCVVIPSPILP